MENILSRYFRCPEEHIQFAASTPPDESIGYFLFGENTCFGRYSGPTSTVPLPPLTQAMLQTRTEDGVVAVPFDAEEIFENLTQERYANSSGEGPLNLDSAINRLYYLIRPMLPVSARKHLQKLRFKDWQKIPFPHWPVDRTADALLDDLLCLAMKAQKIDRIPFIWFWPMGASSAAVVTHDVETVKGRDFCSNLMDIDDSFAVKSAFEVVPENRYDVPASYRDSITGRGFELAVQDLNHDGRLYLSHPEFVKRAARINTYGREWGAEGFRGAILYRRQEWFDALDFSYDMSVPNVAHLDPQRGGCCTIMPYFVGKMLELPVTTTQDYTLFHILKSHSPDLWKRQIDIIIANHGLAGFIVHPDYVTTPKEQDTYRGLLAHLIHLRKTKNVWIAKPSEINHWWRRRAEMRLVACGRGWRIEGKGSEDALVAYASEENGHIKFTLEPALAQKRHA
ncbi:MAG TPA: hypothetical protein VI386_37555 [Candidatus Sulfotelmatobacter sp.]